ncbi:MAG: hydroxylamine reductase, partial [Desulfohalobium sp.]
MFCFQCEQTAHGSGCTKKGVCGKDPDTAAMQDLLIYATKGLSQVAHAARQEGITNNAADRFVCEGTFSTLTNVNFDAERFVPLVHKAVELRDDLHARLNQVADNDAGLMAKIKKAVGLAEDSEVSFPQGPATFQPVADLHGMIKQGHEHGIPDDPEPNEDIKSLKETVIYGLKGACAYADHAAILGQESEDFYAEMHRLLAATLRQDLGLEDWVQLAMDCGQANMKAMELLDAANTGQYGHPVPTEVPLGAKKGPAICVSGHDLHDLELLLKQTEGKGINIYTHGEMLPCHGYPELKKYPHFYGHFGTAWQNQQTEFKQFPGPILMTTNCIQKPREDYADRIYTTG